MVAVTVSGGPVPALFVARTEQVYSVLGDNPVTVYCLSEVVPVEGEEEEEEEEQLMV